jgi:hypothetical protein
MQTYVLSRPNITEEYIHAKEHQIFPLDMGVDKHVGVFLPGAVSVGCMTKRQREKPLTVSCAQMQTLKVMSDVSTISINLHYALN